MILKLKNRYRSPYPNAEVEKPALSSTSTKSFDTEVEKPVSKTHEAEFEKPALIVINIKSFDTEVENRYLYTSK